MKTTKSHQFSSLSDANLYIDVARGYIRDLKGRILYLEKQIAHCGCSPYLSDKHGNSKKPKMGKIIPLVATCKTAMY